MITTETTYRSATLPEAPARATLAEALADEARGVELTAYLAILPSLTDEQWDAAWAAARAEARDAARDAAWDAAWDAARAAARDAARAVAWDAARAVAWAVAAIVARDKISAEHFDTLTAPMRAAGIDFDALVTEPADSGPSGVSEKK